jgi:hypothetical protein
LGLYARKHGDTLSLIRFSNGEYFADLKIVTEDLIRGSIFSYYQPKGPLIIRR